MGSVICTSRALRRGSLLALSGERSACARRGGALEARLRSCGHRGQRDLHFPGVASRFPFCFSGERSAAAPDGYIAWAARPVEVVAGHGRRPGLGMGRASSELTIPLERDVPPPPSPELTYLLTYRVVLPYVVHLH